MKFIFLIEFPFTRRDEHRYGIQLLLGNGFDVEVWELTSFLHAGISFDIPDPSQWRGVRRFDSRKEAQRALAGLPAGSWLFCAVGYRSATYSLFKTIAKARLRFCISRANALPTPQVTMKHKFLFWQIFHYNPTQAWDAIWTRIPHRWLGLKSADLLLAAGKKTVSRRYPLGAATTVLWTHCWDYDLYLQACKAVKTCDSRQGVFLDEYFPYHPDFQLVNIGAPFSDQDYYGTLRRFFGFLERRNGLRIVIAAHPLAQYEKRPDLFGGRRVIRGRTAELVAGSGFVVAHASTARSYAVLFKKPIIFVTSDQINRTIEGPWIHSAAAMLGKRAVNLDLESAPDLREQLCVNEEIYRSYQEAYLKTKDSPDKLFWQIVADYLNSEGRTGCTEPVQ